MKKRQYSLDDRFDEITYGIDVLCAYLHILKGYTEEKSDTNTEVSFIDIFMENIVNEIDKLAKCL